MGCFGHVLVPPPLDRGALPGHPSTQRYRQPQRCPLDGPGPVVGRSSMKAVVVRRFGGPEVLEVAEVVRPEPGRAQVRIKVEAAAVNPVDLATRAGVLAAQGLVVANGAHI